MLGEGSEPLETPARDRLFDMLMRRFDVLQPYREALAVILQDQLLDPLARCCGLGSLGRSMPPPLQGAGFPPHGRRGALAPQGTPQHHESQPAVERKKGYRQ